MLSTAITSRRRPYTRADYRHIRQYYTQAGVSARQVAQQLGRTPLSIKFFISSHPELRKCAAA